MSTRSFFGIAVVLLSVVACDKTEGTKTEGAAATGTPPAAATGAAAPGAGGGAAAATPVGAGAAAPGAPGVTPGGPAAVVNNGQGKSVIAGMDGGAGTLNLANNGQKGSISTNPSGATTIKGADGKTLVVPPIPGIK